MFDGKIIWKKMQYMNHICIEYVNANSNESIYEPSCQEAYIYIYIILSAYRYNPDRYP